MADAVPPPEWLDRANRLATIAWLLSTAVHDANNLLQIISGNAELIEQLAGDNAMLLKRGNSIGVNARKASALLAELLDFARDEAVASSVVDLRELAERSLGLRAYAMKKMRIAASVDGGSGVKVKADARDAVQIVVNLLVNAERALADRPGATVTLLVGGDAAMGTLSVEDNGPGLPEDRRSDVFGSRVAGPGGAGGRLGIGLAVASRLAQRQGGALTYAPRSPSGCLFTLSLGRA